MNDTQLIKDKIDIVDFVSEYIQLKPAGTNHKGLCPFHNEKTPSFMVSRDRQNWHCFGCGKGGDIFSFVQEMEGMEFMETLKFLAKRAGVELNLIQNDLNSSLKNRLKDINSEAANFYHNFLLKMPISNIALEYLKKRGLTEETILEWRIGYVAPQWDLLTQYLLKKGRSIDDLVVSGLTIKKDFTTDRASGFYDRFRGRIMFPICDIHGDVAGFTGRVLVETENSGGKYVNTPQTPLYDKSRIVFGLYLAKQAIKANDLIVVVEGQMDVIACHQAGMRNVVAASGTAFTADQIAILKRYSNNLAIAFDGDGAGQNAAKRGIDLAIEAGINVKIITIPPGFGKDPDECIKINKQVWFEAVKQAKEVMNWYFESVFLKKNLENPKDKQAAANELLPILGRLPYAVEREHWLKELSIKIGVEVSALREDLARLKVASKSLKTPEKESNETKLETSDEPHLSVLSENLLALLLRHPSLLEKDSIIEGKRYLDTESQALYEFINKVYNDSRSDKNQFLANLKTNEGEKLEKTINVLLLKAELDLFNFSEKEALGEIQRLLQRIKEDWIKQKKTVIQTKLRQAESGGNEELIKELLIEYQKIN